MQLTFKQKIFRLVVGAVSATSLLILFTVWNSTAQHAEKQLSEDLETARVLLAQVLELRSKPILNAANVLTDDFGFKRAVASADIPTIESALSNHGRRIDADLMSILTLEGEPLASVPNVLRQNNATKLDELVKRTLTTGPFSKLMAIKGALYQLNFLTVDAPSPIAIAVVGFKINRDVVNQLHAISQLDIGITVSSPGQETFTVNSLDKRQDSMTIELSPDQGLPWFDLLFASQEQRIASSFWLIQRDDLTVEISLSTSTTRVFSSFLNLLFTITIIALLAMCIAIVMGAWLSRQLAKPVESLTTYARRIADGNYEDDIKIETSGQELEYLAKSFNSMQTSIREREQKIVYQAQRDELTGLFNRSYVEALLQEKFINKECFQAIGINIFGFRDINDTFGYHNGDHCLGELASRVMNLKGLSARLTGGELLWVPERALSENELRLMRDSLQRDIFVDELSIPMRVTVGIIECPSDTHNAEDLFRRMNIVLDEAQNTDSKLLRFDAAFETSYLRRLSIITELKKALSTNQHELQLFYQPKMLLKNDEILGVEALIRWQNDKLGFISPEDFIAIAEQAGFINKITEWVYQQAVKDVVNFRSKGVNVSVAVNISAQDVMNPEQLTIINNLLETYALPSEALSFELTEGDLIKDPEQALQHLGYLREAGFNLAIDDFGTGYSSLAYLTQLPINVLKIDKSFVLNLDTSKDDQTIVKTVIKLAHSFGMEVVAEGVENVESLDLLRQWDCNWVQGYFICRPIAAKDLIEWYQKRQAEKS